MSYLKSIFVLVAVIAITHHATTCNVEASVSDSMLTRLLGDSTPIDLGRLRAVLGLDQVVTDQPTESVHDSFVRYYFPFLCFFSDAYLCCIRH
jgi:hypothetical protein